MNSKVKLHSMIIPALVISALLIAIIGISSYINTVSHNITQTDNLVNTNQNAYKDFSLSFFQNNLNIAISTLEHINNKSSSYEKKALTSSINDYVKANASAANGISVPDKIFAMSLTDINDAIAKVDEKSDIYSAFTSLIIDDTPRRQLLFADFLKGEGFYLIYPVINKTNQNYRGSIMGALVAYYSTNTFVSSFFNNNSSEKCVTAVCTTNNNYVISYDYITHTAIKEDKADIDMDETLPESSMTPGKLSNELRSGKSGDFNTVDSDGFEYHVYYEPLTSSSCDIYSLGCITSVINDSGITSKASYNINQKSNYVILSLVIIFAIITAVIVILQNYYEKKQRIANENMTIEKERYKTIVESSQWTIWEYDFSTNMINNVTSDNFEPVHIAQLKSSAMRKQLIFPEDVDTFNGFVDDLPKGFKDLSIQFRMLTQDKEYEWYEAIGTTIYDSNGLPVTTIIRTSNIDSEKKESELIKSISERDALTKLYNLRATKEKITSILENNTGKNMHAMLMFDIDDFSVITETYGTVFGDAILMDISTKLSGIISLTDISCRINADKFIVFLYNIPYISYADEMAEKIMYMFKDIEIGNEDTKQITCSIGISLFPYNGGSFETLLYASDIALYNSKKTGKNKYTIYTDELSSIRTGHDFTSVLTSNISALEGSHTLIDNDIVYNVVQMLFNSRELSSSLTMTFGLIGNYYSFDQIGIIEYADNGTVANCTISWCSKEFERFSSNILSLPAATDKTIALCLNNKNGVFYSNNIDSMDIPASEVTDVIKCAGITSVFQCLISDNGNTIGYLFAHSINRMDWSDHIVDSMTLMTKIIGGYLSKQRTQEDALKLSQTDRLTGCSNLFAFIKSATELSTSKPNTQYATIYMDIDNFKLVNEKYGFSVGDQVLIKLARIIESHLKEDELIGHVDADKFVVYIKFLGMSDFDSRIHNMFSDITSRLKLLIGDKVNLIAGVYLTKNEANISSAVDRANIARKSIKDHRHSTYEIFNEQMKSSLVIKNDIENAMESALENEEFQVFYQPKVDIIKHKICGSEALVRWNRPGQGLISPGVFIPIFEDNGFIVELDFYIFDKVCELLRRLLDEGKPVYPVSVNFSRVHLSNSRILTRLASTINMYNIDPSLIEVEITESALSEGDDFTPSILSSIRNLGFKLSMDDFGSGLSSLNSLRKFPFDILKLDKDFFNTDEITGKEQIVITNVVNLAKELNMEIISEGIETEEQADFLRSIDSPIVQGFLYSPPIPEDKFIKACLDPDFIK